MSRSFRLFAPDGADDPSLGEWIQQVTDAINGLPQIVLFSGNTDASNLTGDPNLSALTADPGAIAMQFENSGLSVFWVKQSGSTTTGWVELA